MAGVVVDSSMALAWSLRDERDHINQHLLEDVVARGAVVPSLWALEVANALLAATRQGRIQPNEMSGILADLGELPIEVDTLTARLAWSQTLRLATKHALTVYDASYLELARRLGLPLATLDQDLRRAAVAEDVAISN